MRAPACLKVAAVSAVLFTMPGMRASAQNGGSTGADGPLNITAPGLTYFDPATVPNHHAGDTIFNFTTITIAQGSTLRLDARNLPGPVYWLATGDVNIAGTLDLSGMGGHNATGNRVDRTFSVPGAGGFAGGPGGGADVDALPGAGPMGGAAAPPCRGAQFPPQGSSGKFSGSQYLIPLVGGSGGGGNCYAVLNQPFECGGGAGGGAVLIASSTSISVSGGIDATGGAAQTPAHCATGSPQSGSGGAIRLVAPAIDISGYVDVNSHNNNAGFIRFETLNLSLHGTNPVQGPSTTAPPSTLAIPATGPSFVKAVTVNGVAMNANPFMFPTFQIDTSSPVPVVIQAQNAPVGATPMLYVISETGPDQSYTAPALQGSFQSSTSTVNIPYPPGGSMGLVRVSWTH
ncbi:MAG: hypothetical protein JOZ62_19145 [Acidobacteriaceae bacterium]|nr:hypothetical protein [Acidobacteriaceae bacterium]